MGLGDGVAMEIEIDLNGDSMCCVIVVGDINRNVLVVVNVVGVAAQRMAVRVAAHIMAVGVAAQRMAVGGAAQWGGGGGQEEGCCS